MAVSGPSLWPLASSLLLEQQSSVEKDGGELWRLVPEVVGGLGGRKCSVCARSYRLTAGLEVMGSIIDV